jgi:hypothetical protein
MRAMRMCDGDHVGVHRTSLVCRWPLGYGIAQYEAGGWALQLADIVLYLCKGGAAYTNDEHAFPFSYHRPRR